MIRILVDSPDPGAATFLRGQLEPGRFDVMTVESGADFAEFARRQCPQIAVIDRVHERHDVAQMKVAALKEVCPDVRIIVISEHPSVQDAGVVEQGVFYYLTLPIGGELIRVIEAGAATEIPGNEP